MKVDEIRTRIAPTPSGYLHIGNVCSFLITWLIAKLHGGTVLLRIDDLDADRMRKEYLDDIFSTLEFMGMQPDRGPSGPEDFLKNYSQRHRINNYYILLDQLKKAGLLYACNCSRKEIQEINPSGIYPATCRHLGKSLEEEGLAWRYAISDHCKPVIEDSITGDKKVINLSTEMGDFVVRRKDGIPAYQVASLSDDIFYDINLVVRGEDLLTSTAAQMALSESLDLSVFSKVHWHHHGLIRDDNYQKLSKSAGDTSIRWMRNQGLSRQMLFSKVSILIFGKPIETSDLEGLMEVAASAFFSERP